MSNLSSFTPCFSLSACSSPAPHAGDASNTFCDLLQPSRLHGEDGLVKRTGSLQSCCSKELMELASKETKAIGSRDASENHFQAYHHATWFVSNAKQAALFFNFCLGFEQIAYKGLETGSKRYSSHVVKNGDVIFEFVSPIANLKEDTSEEYLVSKIHDFIRTHGDGVKDIAFTVSDVTAVFERAVRGGATSISTPHIETDENGSVKMATIQVFDDLWHTLVEYINYQGPFLPHYASLKDVPYSARYISTCIETFPPVRLAVIDHCVQNEDWNKLEPSCDIYEKIFGFHKFWSVDEKDVSTEYSALRSIVMASGNEKIKMPMNEPAKGICKSQIEEFLEFYNGPGVQHIAVLTYDIVTTVRNMRLRGVEFVPTPNLYYESILPRLLRTGLSLEEDISQLQELGILIDFDEKGYLLQIFTKPLTDRPTFFLEIIQRHNHNGFGKGNFKALFETLEEEQRRRGTLLKN